MNKVDVIIPVYRGLEETSECIISAYNSLPEWANLIIINDKSPEQELTDWLRKNKDIYNYQLIENDENYGFVKTVNNGMKLNAENDVLLLNSDVEVANSNWLERIRDAAYSRKKVGSITPFSNNATICSFPNFCEDNELFSNLSVDKIDQIFSSLNTNDILVEVPTGIGFCMYITRDALTDVGYFDEATFGKGYGEENDWCQRAIKKGWLNYHQLNVFAYHKGGVSFAEEGDPRKENALELLAGLHPTYEKQVQEFISKDPAETQRLAAIISYFNSSDKSKILLVSHALGGGVKQHIEELIELFGERVDFILLSPGSKSSDVKIQYLSGRKEIKIYQQFNATEERQVLTKLLKILNIDRVHFHHTLGIPLELFDIIKELEVPYHFTAHDYYLFNTNPTLTDEKGQFVKDGVAQRDFICTQGEDVSLFKSKNESFLSKAELVIFPSVDCYFRFQKEFPCIENDSVICPHPDIIKENIRIRIENYNPVEGKKLKVLVYGALSKEKGADELEFVAMHSSDVEFHLLGYAYRPLNGVITHGPYEHGELQEKIECISPDVIWFPANWPETYSYTLSSALLLSYPIVCPNVGAFSERTVNVSGNTLLKDALSVEELKTFWMLYAKKESVAEFVILRKPDDFYSDNINNDFYKCNYLGFIPSQNKSIISDFSEVGEVTQDANIFSKSSNLNNKEKLLSVLWKLRNSKVIFTVLRFVPYKLQRAIKRKLSSKPLHDIVNK